MQVCGGRCFCELQWQLQQFYVGLGKLCIKLSSFHRCSCTFLRNVWLTVDTCSATAPWCSWTFCLHYLCEGDVGILKSILALLSWCLRVHSRCFGSFPWWVTWTLGHYFNEPSHLAVTRSLSLHCCSKVFSCIRHRRNKDHWDFRPSISLRDCRCNSVLWPCTLHFFSTCPKRQQQQLPRWLALLSWAGELSSQFGPDPCGGPGWWS